MQSFKDFDCWKVGIELLREVYVLSSRLPAEERFGLTSQVRRASVSILANIAEGCGRFTFADKGSKFIIARGECSEVEALLIIISSLGFANEESTAKALSLADREAKILSGIIRSLRKKSLQRTE